MMQASFPGVAGHRRGPLGGLFRSGPVSRILSCAAEAACGLPGPRRAGSTVLLGLAPGGVCLAAASPRRRCALTAPFHLCLFAAHVWLRHRPCISVALSRGFPRVGVTHRLALWCPDFPRGVFSPPAAVRPAQRWYRGDVAWRLRFGGRNKVASPANILYWMADRVAGLGGPASDQILRKTPTTLPRTLASVVRIGSI